MSELNNFTRLFKNVKKCKDLCWQEKAILSEILSYHLDGKPFKHKDLTLAIELGMDKGTISKFINRLHKRGVIGKVTVSFPSPSGGKHKRQRTVTISDPDKWTKGDTIPSVRKLEPKGQAKDHADEVIETAIPETPVITDTIIQNQTIQQKTIEPIPQTLTVNEESLNVIELTSSTKKMAQLENTDSDNSIVTLDYDNDITNNELVGQSIIEHKVFNFFPVKVLFNDGNDALDEAVAIPHSKKYYLKTRLLMIDPMVLG